MCRLYICIYNRSDAGLILIDNMELARAFCGLKAPNLEASIGQAAEVALPGHLSALARKESPNSTDSSEQGF